MKVLLADDEKTIAVTLSDTLRAAGHEVSVTNDGTHAWRMIQEADFDCLLLDIKMPQMDGMEILKRIKASRPQLPVVMITGFGSVETAIEAMKRGAFDYVQKPFNNIAGRARDMGNYGLLIGDEPIEKAGLADIGPAA